MALGLTNVQLLYRVKVTSVLHRMMSDYARAVAGMVGRRQTMVRFPSCSMFKGFAGRAGSSFARAPASWSPCNSPWTAPDEERWSLPEGQLWREIPRRTPRVTSEGGISFLKGRSPPIFFWVKTFLCKILKEKQGSRSSPLQEILLSLFSFSLSLSFSFPLRSMYTMDMVCTVHYSSNVRGAMTVRYHATIILLLLRRSKEKILTTQHFQTPISTLFILRCEARR